MSFWRIIFGKNYFLSDRTVFTSWMYLGFLVSFMLASVIGSVMSIFYTNQEHLDELQLTQEISNMELATLTAEQAMNMEFKGGSGAPSKQSKKDEDQYYQSPWGPMMFRRSEDYVEAPISSYQSYILSTGNGSPGTTINIQKRTLPFRKGKVISFTPSPFNKVFNLDNSEHKMNKRNK